MTAYRDRGVGVGVVERGVRARPAEVARDKAVRVAHEQTQREPLPASGAPSPSIIHQFSSDALLWRIM